MSEAFFPQEIIRKKRDGDTLSAEEIDFFVRGITDNSITEGQVAAFAMAVFFQDMNDAETLGLTTSILNSGDIMDWASYGVDGPLVEKHSTGGVGDKITLMLAPIVAACGAKVPTISGRGLGHSGGTLDKLESIPGYNATPGLELFAKVVKDVGCSIIGQTSNLAPADKRLYGIRDVTATVESIPLITASILSKKLAAGANGLVMDVKFGNGAFMSSYEKAQALTANLVKVANQAGLPTSAIISDMNEVLGKTAGNAVEMQETIEYLKGSISLPRLHEVTMTLASEMLVIVGIEDDLSIARRRAEDALSSGNAAEIFSRMVAAHGGPADLLDHPEKYLKLAPVVRDVKAKSNGYISEIDTRSVGLTVVGLGGGRTQSDQDIDHGVGVTNCSGLGQEVKVGDVLCQILANSEEEALLAERRLHSAFIIGHETVSISPVIHDIIRP